MRFTSRWPAEASMMMFGYGMSIGESIVCSSSSCSKCLSVVERDT